MFNLVVLEIFVIGYYQP